MQFFFFNLDMYLDVTEWCTRSVISVLVRVKNSVWTSASTNMSGCPVWKSLSPRTADMGSEHQTPYLMVNIPHPLWNPSSVKKKKELCLINKIESYSSGSEMSLNIILILLKEYTVTVKQTFFQVEQEFYHLVINLFMGNIYCQVPVSESILYIVKRKIVKFSHSKSVYWLLIKR